MIVAPFFLMGGAALFANGLWILGILGLVLGFLAFYGARRAMIRAQVDEVLRNSDDEPVDRP